MDVREKLVELLNGVQHYGTICTMSQMDDRYASITQVSNTEVAESLIAHGVTVQEWISVNNMLPKIYDKDSDWSGTVLFRTTQGHIHSGRRKFGRHRMSFWIDESDNLFFSKEEVTHWMPLPAPPKGE